MKFDLSEWRVGRENCWQAISILSYFSGERGSEDLMKGSTPVCFLQNCKNRCLLLIFQKTFSRFAVSCFVTTEGFTILK